MNLREQPPGDSFTVESLSGNLASSRPILEDSEDLAEIQIELDNSTVGAQALQQDEDFEVVLRTESGASIQKTLEVPSLLDASEDNELVQLNG